MERAPDGVVTHAMLTDIATGMGLG